MPIPKEIVLRNKAFGNVHLRYSVYGYEEAFVEGFRKFLRNYTQHAVETLTKAGRTHPAYNEPRLYVTTPQEKDLLMSFYYSENDFGMFRYLMKPDIKIKIWDYEEDTPNPKDPEHVYIFSRDVQWMHHNLFEISQTQWHIEYYTFMEEK